MASTAQYIVNINMGTALQVDQLEMLCHLICYQFPEGAPTVELRENGLVVSFWRDAVLEENWSATESKFFDGLKFLDLIEGWQAQEQP